MRIGDSTHSNMPASADGCLDKGRRFGGVEIGHLPILIASGIAVRDLCKGEAKSWSPRPPPSPSRSALQAGDHDHPGPSHLAKALAVVPVCALTQRVVCGDRPALHAIEPEHLPFFPIPSVHDTCTWNMRWNTVAVILLRSKTSLLVDCSHHTYVCQELTSNQAGFDRH